MARSKKDFSKEAMYKKIMPSILINDDENGDVVDDVVEDKEKLQPKNEEIEAKDLSQLLKEDTEVNKVLNNNKFIKLDMSEKLFKKTSASDEVIKKIVSSIDESNIENENIEESTKDEDENEEDLKYTEDRDLKDTENEEREKEEDEEDEEEETINLISSIYKKKKNILNKVEKEESEITVSIMKSLLEKKIKFALTKFKVDNKESFTEYFIDNMVEKYPDYKITGTKEFIDFKMKEYEEKSGINFNEEIVKAIILHRKFEK